MSGLNDRWVERELERSREERARRHAHWQEQGRLYGVTGRPSLWQRIKAWWRR